MTRTIIPITVEGVCRTLRTDPSVHLRKGQVEDIERRAQIIFTSLFNEKLLRPGKQPTAAVVGGSVSLACEDLGIDSIDSAIANASGLKVPDVVDSKRHINKLYHG